MEEMIKDRRTWIKDYKRDHGNKVPDDIRLYHEQFKKQEDADDPKEAAAAKKKDGGKKPAKSGVGKKKDDDKKARQDQIGPTETVDKFDDFHNEFSKHWASRDEANNFQ